MGYTANPNYWPMTGARAITVNEVVSLKTDLTEADFSSADTVLANQGAAWLRDLLKESCEGSTNPQGCYDDLQKQSPPSISGPSTVTGPTSTTTGTYTRTDGTTGTTSTTSQTTFNIRYGDNYFDYDTNITTTHNKDGQQVSQDTTSDAGVPEENPDQEEQPQEEEEPKREVAGEGCSAALSCAGDAIDCAVLRQAKDMRCSLDWPSQSSSVQAEAAKSEYQLQKSEIDAASLFSGPSAARWLPSYCPTDRTLYLETANASVTFSWSFICQYSTALSFLCVGLASLFFAVYVGRAFGGD